MAKKQYKPRQHDSGIVITTKTPFGSHKEMVIANTTDINLHEDQVICKDDRGHYITTKNRIDNGLADPSRYDSKTRLKIEEPQGVDNEKPIE
jgi:hypothetical protein